MIQITITRLPQDSSIESVSLTGHANSAQYGQDLVCAAASGIMITAMEALSEMFENACSFVQKNNKAEIRVVNNSADLQICLEMLSRQLACFEEMYPDFAQLRKKEKNERNRGNPPDSSGPR